MKIKLKDLLKESVWGKRAFGDALPTMDDYLKEYEQGKVYTDKDKPPFKTAQELSEEKLDEVGKFKVSSQPYKAWQEHGDHNNKLFNDAHWAMKAFPNKKKEIKEIQQLSSKLKNLIAVIQGQAMDL